MLQALLDNLSVIAGIELELMLDVRCQRLINTAGLSITLIGPQQDSLHELKNLAQQCDAVWPVAPETEGVLQNICRMLEDCGAVLLTSPSTAVADAGNKFITYQRLLRYGIATVPSHLFDPKKNYPPGEWIVKPVDGVGSESCYLINHQQDFKRLPIIANSIIQPHVDGIKTSLSCLFKAGQGWLLSVNRQFFSLIKKQYHLDAIIVNYPAKPKSYQAVVAKVAQAFPDLWGYVGIDLIETQEQIIVLEINPRLTSSFVGIFNALGFNVAQSVLELLAGEPNLQFTCNQAVTIFLNQEANG